MSLRIKLLALLAVLACAVVAVPQFATGAKTRTHTLDATVKLAILESSGGVGHFAGSSKGTPLGPMAVIGNERITGTTAVIRGRFYGIAGTVKFEATQTIEPQPDGSVKTSGSGKFTGGTGRYRDVTGRARFSGTIPAGDYVITQVAHGTIRY